MNKENILEAIQCMVGNYTAIGETYHDKEAYENLKKLGFIIEQLVDSIAEESLKSNSNMWSVSNSGEMATEILNRIKDEIEDYLC